LKTYIDNTNKLKAGSAFEKMSLQKIICNASGGLFNNAAQVYNHYFYFEALQAPESENIPPHLQALIQKNFGDIIDFKEHFSQTALSLFGSGWVWLIKDEEKLEIWPTENAGTPLVEGKKPLLALDVWEHAYYLDTQNARAKYIENFWKVVNWEVVEKRIH
jgi:Fe-Mn family superoxide dismutase